MRESAIYRIEPQRCGRIYILVDTEMLSYLFLTGDAYFKRCEPVEAEMRVLLYVNKTAPTLEGVWKAVMAVLLLASSLIDLTVKCYCLKNVTPLA